MNEEKSPKWMDAEIKNKEVDICIDDQPKITKIGDYWTEEKTAEIVNLFKEYH